MLSKCANPACTARLRYLRDGKIFRVEAHAAHPSSEHHLENSRRDLADAVKLERRIQPEIEDHAIGAEVPPEYFWLCGTCAATFTLAVRDRDVVLLSAQPPPGVPRVHHAAAS